jgi:hypothetical protein
MDQQGQSHNTTYDNEEEMLHNNNNNNVRGNNNNSRPNFKLGEYFSASRPTSALSAHERLFGTSRYGMAYRPQGAYCSTVYVITTD